MFGKKSLLSRKQIKLICVWFKCRKSDFAVRRYADGYLVSVRNREYRVKFSEGFSPQIVYAKEIQMVTKKK